MLFNVISLFVSIRIYSVAVKEKLAPKFTSRTKRKTELKEKKSHLN